MQKHKSEIKRLELTQCSPVPTKGSLIENATTRIPNSRTHPPSVKNSKEKRGRRYTGWNRRSQLTGWLLKGMKPAPNEGSPESWDLEGPLNFEWMMIGLLVSACYLNLKIDNFEATILVAFGITLLSSSENWKLQSRNIGDWIPTLLSSSENFEAAILVADLNDAFWLPCRNLVTSYMLPPQRHLLFNNHFCWMNNYICFLIVATSLPLTCFLHS